MTIIILHIDSWKFLQAFLQIIYLWQSYSFGKCFCFLWKLYIFHTKKKDLPQSFVVVV